MPDPLKTIQGKSGLSSPDLGNKVRLSFNGLGALMGSFCACLQSSLGTQNLPFPIICALSAGH